MLWQLPNTAGSASRGVAATIDNFDDLNSATQGGEGTLDSAWIGDRGEATIQSDVVKSGTHALRLVDTGVGSTRIVSLPAHIDTQARDRLPDGRAAYPRAGDTIRYYVRAAVGSDQSNPPQCRSRFGFAVQDGVGATHFSVQINHHTDKIFLIESRDEVSRIVAEGSEVFNGFPAHTWFTVDLSWSYEGQITVTCRAPDGTVKSTIGGSLSGSPARPFANSGGVFFDASSSAPVAVYFDSAVIPTRTGREIEGFESGLSNYGRAESPWATAADASLPGPEYFEGDTQSSGGGDGEGYLPHYINIEGSGTRCEYVLEVTDAHEQTARLEKSSRNASINPDDILSNNDMRADGYVISGNDAYRFSGALSRLDVGSGSDPSLSGATSSVTVTINGLTVDPTVIPSGGSPYTPPNTDANRQGLVGRPNERGHLRITPGDGAGGDLPTDPQPGDTVDYYWRAGDVSTPPETASTVGNLEHYVMCGVQSAAESARHYELYHSFANREIALTARYGNGTSSTLGKETLSTDNPFRAGSIYRTRLRWPLSASLAYAGAADIGPAPDAPTAFEIETKRMYPKPEKLLAKVPASAMTSDATFREGGIGLYKNAGGRFEADRITIRERQAGARVSHTLANFENTNPLSRWGRVDTPWSITASAALSGSWGLRGAPNAAGHVRTTPGDGLNPDFYPRAGDTFEFRWRAPETGTGGDSLVFYSMVGVQSSNAFRDQYEIFYDFATNDIRSRLLLADGTKRPLGETSAPLDASTTYRTRLTWMPATDTNGNRDGRIGVTLIDESDWSVVGRIADPTPDTTFTSGGVGFYKNSPGKVYIDDLRVTERVL